MFLIQSKGNYNEVKIMNIQPIKINFNNKTYQITFKGIDNDKLFLKKDLKLHINEFKSEKRV